MNILNICIVPYIISDHEARLWDLHYHGHLLKAICNAGVWQYTGEQMCHYYLSGHLCSCWQYFELVAHVLTWSTATRISFSSWIILPLIVAAPLPCIFSFIQDVQLVSFDTRIIVGHWIVQFRRLVETCDPDVRSIMMNTTAEFGIPRKYGFLGSMVDNDNLADDLSLAYKCAVTIDEQYLLKYVQVIVIPIWSGFAIPFGYSWIFGLGTTTQCTMAYKAPMVRNIAGGISGTACCTSMDAFFISCWIQNLTYILNFPLLCLNIGVILTLHLACCASAQPYRAG